MTYMNVMIHGHSCNKERRNNQVELSILQLVRNKKPIGTLINTFTYLERDREATFPFCALAQNQPTIGAQLRRPK